MQVRQLPPARERQRRDPISAPSLVCLTLGAVHLPVALTYWATHVGSPARQTTACSSGGGNFRRNARSAFVPAMPALESPLLRCARVKTRQDDSWADPSL